MLLNSHKKNGKNLLTVAFIAQKLWMVVYTATIKKKSHCIGCIYNDT